MEISNLSERAFKVMVIEMLTGLRRRTEEYSKNFDKELRNRKNNHSWDNN